MVIIMTAIVTKNLTKKFGELTAVNSLNLEINEGELFGLLGPNGAGKTTTINMLVTLMQPSGGSATVNGFDLREQDKVRKSIGIVFQDPSLDEELTASENMELHGVLYNVPRRLRRERTEQLLKFVELWDRKGSLVKQFSGGMKRRLEIARGLLHHPKVIFLDEPTLGLDPQTRNHVWTYLKDLNQSEGITIFFTTHYMDEADRVAQRIAIIDQGKIVASGTPQELRAQTGTTSLEDAFLALTGKTIREEEAGSMERMRMMHRAHGRR